MAVEQLYCVRKGLLGLSTYMSCSGFGYYKRCETSEAHQGKDGNVSNMEILYISKTSAVQNTSVPGEVIQVCVQQNFQNWCSDGALHCGIAHLPSPCPHSGTSESGSTGSGCVSSCPQDSFYWRGTHTWRFSARCAGETRHRQRDNQPPNTINT